LVLRFASPRLRPANPKKKLNGAIVRPSLPGEPHWLNRRKRSPVESHRDERWPVAIHPVLARISEITMKALVAAAHRGQKWEREFVLDPASDREGVLHGKAVAFQD
jgi:hypothetical protein